MAETEWYKKVWSDLSRGFRDSSDSGSVAHRVSEVSSSIHRRVQSWLDEEGAGAAAAPGAGAQKGEEGPWLSSFEARSDIEALRQQHIPVEFKDADLFLKFMPFFEVGLHVVQVYESSVPGAREIPRLCRLKAAFIQGRQLSEQVLGESQLDLRLPENRMQIQRARARGGLLRQLGLERLRAWNEPSLLFIPVRAGSYFIFVCDRPDMFQRHLAEQAQRIVLSWVRGQT